MINDEVLRTVFLGGLAGLVYGLIAVLLGRGKRALDKSVSVTSSSTTSLSPTSNNRFAQVDWSLTRTAESLIGDGNEVAHVDLIMGPHQGAVGRAFANAFVNCSHGFTPLLAMLAPNLIVKPPTLVINKVNMKSARPVVQFAGPVQSAVAKAVVDSVAEGVIPKDRVDEILICVSVFIHWDATDDKKLYDFNYYATKEAISRAVLGDPTITAVLQARGTARHPFSAEASLEEENKKIERIRQAAAQGNASAQFDLALCYINRTGGLEYDENEIVRLAKLAANQGHISASSLLGVSYAEGLGGLPKDEHEARRLLELAAAHGDVRAQNELEKRDWYKVGGAPSGQGSSKSSPPPRITKLTEEHWKEPIAPDNLKKDWDIAVDYCEDLSAISHRLARISPRIDFEFKKQLLVSKSFDHRHKLANALEEKFLTEHFGSRNDVREFARILLKLEERAAAQELNEVIYVMGEGVDFEKVKKKLDDKYELYIP